MKLFSWSNNKKSASYARERLKIIIIEDRKRQSEELHAALIDQMKKDILDVVQRYIKIVAEDIGIKRTSQNERDILELNINIQDREIILPAILQSQRESADE